jgi:hypothetical protein
MGVSQVCASATGGSKNFHDSQPATITVSTTSDAEAREPFLLHSLLIYPRYKLAAIRCSDQCQGIIHPK